LLLDLPHCLVGSAAPIGFVYGFKSNY